MSGVYKIKDKSKKIKVERQKRKVVRRNNQKGKSRKFI